tara:strand:- start:46 stop:270 length:225 start_codon:yes stop_codon:yes gene_type:complete
MHEDKKANRYPRHTNSTIRRLSDIHLLTTNTVCRKCYVSPGIKPFLSAPKLGIVDWVNSFSGVINVTKALAFAE